MSTEVRLLSSRIEITPSTPLTWINDVFGNAVASASFDAPADSLTIDSTAVVALTAARGEVIGVDRPLALAALLDAVGGVVVGHDPRTVVAVVTQE